MLQFQMLDRNMEYLRENGYTKYGGDYFIPPNRRSMAGKESFPFSSSPSCGQQVNCVIGLLMGGITHGCITRAGQAVSGPLTGAAFPECLAAVPQRAVRTSKSPAALCWRAKRVHLPQTQVIRFSLGPYTGNQKNALLLLLLHSHLLPLRLCFTSNQSTSSFHNREGIACLCARHKERRKKRDRNSERMNEDNAQTSHSE